MSHTTTSASTYLGVPEFEPGQSRKRRYPIVSRETHEVVAYGAYGTTMSEALEKARAKQRELSAEAAR